jgi:excisionase family DNA binding protein
MRRGQRDAKRSELSRVRRRGGGDVHPVHPAGEGTREQVASATPDRHRHRCAVTADPDVVDHHIETIESHRRHRSLGDAAGGIGAKAEVSGGVEPIQVERPACDVVGSCRCRAWMSTQEAANRLGVTTRTLYRFVDEGLIPAYKMGRVFRLQKRDVDAFIETSRVEPGTLEHLYPERKSVRIEETGT